MKFVAGAIVSSFAFIAACSPSEEEETSPLEVLSSGTLLLESDKSWRDTTGTFFARLTGPASAKCEEVASDVEVKVNGIALTASARGTAAVTAESCTVTWDFSAHPNSSDFTNFQEDVTLVLSDGEKEITATFSRPFRTIGLFPEPETPVPGSPVTLSFSAGDRELAEAQEARVRWVSPVGSSTGSGSFVIPEVVFGVASLSFTMPSPPDIRTDDDANLDIRVTGYRAKALSCEGVDRCTGPALYGESSSFSYEL